MEDMTMQTVYESALTSVMDTPGMACLLFVLLAARTVHVVQVRS